MDEIEATIVFSKETKNKAQDIYATIIDRLHRYLVIENKEAKMDSLVSLLSALNTVVLDSEEINKTNSEVEVL